LTKDIGLAAPNRKGRGLSISTEAFVDPYNNQRYHESLDNVTPTDVYVERHEATLQQRERVKRKTLEARRLHHGQRTA